MGHIWFIVGAIFGVLIGVLFTVFIKRKQVSRGTLIIDLTDPERDIFRLVLDEDLESLAKQTQIRLEVKVETNSQQ